MISRKINQQSLVAFASSVFVLDLYAFPMFHFFSIPVKFAFIALIAFYLLLIAKGSVKREDLFLGVEVFIPIFAIILLGTFGQLYLQFLGGVLDPVAYFHQLAIYLLMFLSFLFGVSSRSFPLKVCVISLYAISAWILYLVFIPESFPFLTSLWWRSAELAQERMLLNEIRPTPFGDGSMVSPTILFLFITLFKIKKWLEISDVHYWVMATLVVFLSLLLGSRNQFLAIALIIFIFLLTSKNKLGSFVLFVTAFVPFAIILISLIANEEGLGYSVSRVLDFGFVFSSEDDGVSRANTLARPFYTWERFLDRLHYSPLVGSGYSVLGEYPFHRMNFHNDFFYVAISSGMVGLAFYIIFILRLYFLGGVIVVLPFFLPGATNSFLHHVQGILGYCFLMGVYAGRSRFPKAVPRSTSHFN